MTISDLRFEIASMALPGRKPRRHPLHRAPVQTNLIVGYRRIRIHCRR